MNPSRDPMWLGTALRLYDVALRLYPAALRHAHGEEMRQAFRDRCLEFASGRVSARRVFLAELVPDFISSLALARTEEAMFSNSRRPLVGLAVLVLLAIVFVFQARISPLLLNATFATQAHWQHWNDERDLERDEGQVRWLADRLATSPQPADRALAASLYRVNQAGRRNLASYTVGYPEHLTFAPLDADGEKAARLLATLPAGSAGDAGWMATMACSFDPSCDPAPRLEAMVRIDPGDGYAWSQLLKLHAAAGNDSAVVSDLHAVATASRFDDRQQALRTAGLAAAERMAPGDPRVFAGIARRQLAAAYGIMDDDYRHEMRYLCMNYRGFEGPRWLDAHPASRADCASAARLAVRAGSPSDSAWGWRWLDNEASTPATRAALKAAQDKWMHESWPGQTRIGERTWRAWTDAEWLAWAEDQLDRSKQH